MLSPWHLTGVLATIAVALSIALMARYPGGDDAKYELVAPPKELQKAPDYTPEERARVIPHIELGACIFTQGALRYSLRPQKVSFTPCSIRGDYEVGFREDLGMATVVGRLEINGAINAFTAVLNHHPFATEIDGFQAVRFEIGPPLIRNGTRPPESTEQGQQPGSRRSSMSLWWLLIIVPTALGLAIWVWTEFEIWLAKRQ
jgi:hypothetical protein